MTIRNSINRKLLSFITPYLVHEPNLDLKLGFLTSDGVARSLVFDSELLNSEVFSEPTRFVFKEVRVERITVKVSYWSVDTFVIEVRGLHVVLESREDRPLGVKSDTGLEERKRILAEIDLEGSALHDVLQNLSETNAAKNQRTSLLDVLLEHCQLQIHGIDVHVHFPFANDSCGISFEIKQLNLGSVGSNECFMRSLVGVFISPLKDLFLSLDVKGFEVGLKKKDGDSCLISSVDFSAHMKFNNLKLVSCDIEVPEIIFLFNPVELSVVFVVYALLCNESNQTRNGRHLWNIAADRIGSLTRFSLYTLVLMVCIWIQYVNMYEDLLLLVGYPEEKAMNISAIIISEDDKFSASVKNKWKKLCEFEKKLSAEAISRTRRIARYRAELVMENRENDDNAVLANNNFKFCKRIILVISLVWNIISKIFFFLVIWRKNPKCGGTRVVSENSSAQGCFHIRVGSVSVAISPLNYAQSRVHGYKSSDLGSSSLDLQQICVSVDGLIILRTVGVCEQNFTVSCGQIKVISSSVNDDNPKNKKDPKRYLNKKTVDLERIVLKTQPASTFYIPNETGGTSSSVLQDLFDKVWSNWKLSCTEFKQRGIQYCDIPWMFCETKKSVTDKSLKNVGSGFWKGSLMLGKVFIFLDYSTISSISLVLGQIKTVYLWAQGNKADVIFPAPVTENISQPLTWDEKGKTLVGVVEKMLLKILPQKHIEICIFIAGPLIRLPLRKDLLNSQYINKKKISGQDENHLVVSIHDIELAVWPIEEHQKISIPRFGSEKYKSHQNILLETYVKANGIEAVIEDSAENKKYRIVLLKPSSIKLSSARHDVYSLDSAVIAISTTWQAVAAGISVLLFMDELFVLSKVLIDIFSPISHTINSSSSFTGARSKVLLRQEQLMGTPVRRTENVPSTFTEVNFILNGTFEISSMEIILQNSRKGNTRENNLVCYDQISRKKIVINDLPDYGTILLAQKMSLGISFTETEVQMNADLFDSCSIVFRDQSDIWTIVNHFQIRDMINSLSSLCEISVSHFNFALRLPNLFCFSNEIEETSTCWLVVNFTTNEIYLTGLSVKEILIGTHKSNKLESSVVFGKDFQTICCQIKGGSFFLETTALALFVKCFASYHNFIKKLVPIQPQHMIIGVAEDIVVENSDQHVTWGQLQELKIDFSQSSFILVAADETGISGFREIQFEADFLLNLENRTKKFSFDLSRLTILSQTLNNVVEQKSSEIQIPHFSTSWSSGQSSDFLLEDQSVLDNSMPKLLNLSRQNYILKRFGVSVTVERPFIEESDRSQSLDQGWTGSGAILGLDMTTSLQEIQMVISALESLPVFSSEQTANNVGDGYQESDRSLISMPPDGAIVAIQDVDQHSYMAVDSLEGKYSLVGTIHYSLVGERALFRVKYQNQKRWGSSALWFSLISLHAKNSAGEPLWLNYRKGSGFVDISSASDESEALWTTISFNSKNEELETKPESYNFSGKNTFYFVNKKTDRAVAFVEEVPEFVTKPGNLFKWKVFHDFSLFGKFPRIDITVEKVIMTLVHELPDTKETFPLLRASICTTESVVHLQLSKVRAMGRLSFVLQFFDGQSNLWTELIDQVDLCVFYRSRFQVQDSRIGPHTESVSFYARMKKFGVSITELSLDTLLFVIGTLDLAGPFAINISKILSNSCKVQNYCGLDLLCHFYDDQDTSVASKQTSTIFLRHLASMHQIPEASKFSIQLSQRGSYLTSPINLCLLEAGSLAWRTRIVSTRDSKTYPGPFLIIDLTRISEEGLSISVSPLLRIYNETKFSMELSFRCPQQEATKATPVVLKTGESIDESVAAFDAISLSGDSRKALMSLSVGNFLLSFRPDVMDDLASSKRPISVEWSLDIKGGKTVKISGVFDKLSYKVRKAFSLKPVKVSFSTAHCSLKYEDGQVADLHFLIQVVIREIPVILPDNYGDATQNRDSPVAVKEQKEIFILPTFRIMNLLQVEIHVLLTDSDPGATVSVGNIGNEANISSSSTVDLYADPAAMYFIVTLTEFNSSCKPVNSGDCVRKLQKKKEDVAFLDVDLVFGGGKYFASLRLSRGNRGVMEATVFTPYTLRNDTDLSLLCFASNRKPFSRENIEKLEFMIPPEDGSLLPPKSTKSWFMKHNKVRLKLVEQQASEVLLDLDSLSGLAEIGLEAESVSGTKHIMKLGLSLGPLGSKADISQIVTMVPRHIVSNESGESVIFRQYDVEDDQEGEIEIPCKQKFALRLRTRTTKKEINVFEKLVYKHRNTYDDSSTFIQFKRNKVGLGWSGPVCVASLGRFFLKFRKYDNTTLNQSSMPEFASVHVVEENSTLVSHFYKPPDVNLPYRIENNLHQTNITYFQKDSFDPEILGPGNKVDYVWDDLTRPRRLVVQIDGLNLRREINLDKVRGWKPFYRASQQRGLGSRLPLDKNSDDNRKANFNKPFGQQLETFGYEISADGATRVLRFSDLRASFKRNALCPSKRVRIKISSIALNLLENVGREMNAREVQVNTPIVVGRIENVSLIFVLSDKHIYNKMTVQSLSVDQKWVGTPFAAMLRRHQSDSNSMNGDILHIVLVILSSSSSVRQIKHSSVVLQPISVNIDEETLMRLVPFWRTSLSESKTPSRQYYFDHFEIHPVKIVGNFLPGDSISSYSSPQETLRTLLHSVIKIPAIKSKTIELNGVLVTHALITIKELFIKCAQHYSWYAMRAIYIAKGSPLLPPAFASIFDDLASSSLDAFFDPSSGLINVPGLTIGTFKLLSKCVDGKGFSGTKRYLGDLGKTMKTAGSNILFAAVTEISDSMLKGAEASGVNGMVSGFHQGVLKLAMEPSVLGAAFMEGGPDRKIMLDQSPGIDELYIEGYLQAMLDTTYKQEYLRVRVVDNQVFLKNLPPNSSLIEEIMDRVKSFLVSKALLKGDSSISQPLRHLRGHTEWKIGPTIVTLCEHLFVSFAIRFLRKQTGKFIVDMNLKEKFTRNDEKAIVPASSTKDKPKMNISWKWGIGKFMFSGVLAYIDGRLCRRIPNPVVRRIVSGFILSFLDMDDG